MNAAADARAAVGLRLRQLPAQLRGAAVGVGGAVRLAWRASGFLTVALLVLVIVAGLVPAAMVAVAREVIDLVVAAVGGPTPKAAAGPIFLLVGLQFLVTAVNAAGNALRAVAERLLGERVMLTVQVEVMEHASRMELPFFDSSASYDLLRQAGQDAASRPASMISVAFNQIQGTITLVSLVGLLVGLGPVVALAAVLGPVPVFVSEARFGRRMFDFALWASPIRRRMQYTNGLVTTDTAAKEVKLYGLGPFLVGRFRDLGEELYRRTRKLLTSRNLAVAGWGLLAAATASLAFVYTVWQALSGRLTVGDVVLCSTALIGVQAAVQGLLRGVATLYQDSLFLGLLRRFLSIPAEDTAGTPEKAAAFRKPPHVLFERVSFSYPGSGAPVLDSVSFEILPGETLAIVGRNGAGKSTLIKLLCGLYRPTSGRIRLDGKDLRDMEPKELRAGIAAMFQDYMSYQASAAENIALGDVAHYEDRERIEASARAAGADEFIEGLPRGYDTPLGRWFDEGVEISGGQWQRLALGRAFMRRGLLLVLDEPTAALDAQSEHELFERLRRLAQGRTTVYISHRFSTVRRADRVLLLENGKVAEHGTHVELMTLDGEYARLFRLQASPYHDVLGPVPALKEDA